MGWYVPVSSLSPVDIANIHLEGIRNFVARNNLRAMEIGDQVLFSESNVKQPGLVGIMEVVGLARPDPSQFSPDSPYYDPKSKESDPKWSMVMVEFRSKFDSKLTAATLKKHAGEGGPLKDLALFKQSRLSVQRVEEDEWKFIMSLVADQGSEPVKKAQSKKTKAVEKDVVPSVERAVTPPRPSFLGRIADVLTSPVRAVSRALSGTPAPNGVEGEKGRREGSGLAAVPEE